MNKVITMGWGLVQPGQGGGSVTLKHVKLDVIR